MLRQNKPLAYWLGALVLLSNLRIQFVEQCPEILGLKDRPLLSFKAHYLGLTGLGVGYMKALV